MISSVVGDAELVRVAQDLPAGPRLLVELGQLIRDPRTDAADVIALLRQDASLVARIIRMANSVAYARAEPAGSIEEAVAGVGFREVHRLVGAVAATQLHDDLDTAVADAYGWPWPLSDEDILARVVALNAARAAEEAKGIIRWLRSDYQKPRFAGEKQSTLGLGESADAKSTATKKPKAKATAKKKPAWPATLAERVRAVEVALAAEEKPASAVELAARFSRAKASDVMEILQTLVTLGRARPGDAKGTFVR